MKLCGVDEAGKGSVLGPMVTSGIIISDFSELSRLGIKDSKQLTPKKRKDLFNEIVSSFTTYSAVKTPEDIDSRPSTMNRFTAECHAEVVRNLSPDVAYLDACDVNEKRFGDNVKRLSGVNADIISEHKADDKYKIVGAASIVAKVTRDNEIEILKSEYGDIGSGYPSDPTTIAFLKNYIKKNGCAPACARKTWQTIDDIINETSQKRISDFLK